MGLILLCDDFSDIVKQVNPNSKIACLSDAGYFLDYVDDKY